MVKERTCLRCDKNFKSPGPYRRICPECTYVGERVASLPLHKVALIGGGNEKNNHVY